MTIPEILEMLGEPATIAQAVALCDRIAGRRWADIDRDEQIDLICESVDVAVEVEGRA